MFDFTLNIQIK